MVFADADQSDGPAGRKAFLCSLDAVVNESKIAFIIDTGAEGISIRNENSIAAYFKKYAD